MIAPKKNLGQHYLTDQSKLNYIANYSTSISKQIIEIGPGTGQLTKKLIEFGASDIIAIEKDSRFLNLLNELNNVKVINEDILKSKFECLPDDYIMVGNLPYNISAPIIIKFTKHIQTFKNAVFLIQKEVADKITSKCNERNYGRISCFIQSVADVKKILHVPPGCFFPAPKVDSEVISIKSNNIKIDLDKLDIVLRQAFSNPRKTIQNNLKHLQNLESTLLKHNCNIKMRPNNIPIKAYIDLSMNIDF